MKEYTKGECHAFAESELLKRMLKEGYMPICYAIEIAENESSYYSKELVELAENWLKNNLNFESDTPIEMPDYMTIKMPF